MSMSARPLAALARAAAPSMRPSLPLRRSILTPSAGGPTLPRGAAAGVDARIFAGLPEFVGQQEMARVNEWQAGLWGRLQEEVRNNPKLAPIKLKWDNDSLDIAELLSFAAREPSLSLAFNYASLLINNSYFLEGLNADAPKPIPAHFKPLEDRVAAYADGVVGSAWLWLVKSGEELTDFDVVPTFASGTLLVTSRQQRGRDVSTVFGQPETSGAEDAGEAAAAGEATEGSAAPATPAAPAPNAPRYASRRKTSTEVTPLAVLNLFEHAYLGDRYGVFSRGDYARDWFRQLDWDKVAKRAATSGVY